MWSPLEQSAFESFASVLSLAPELTQWTPSQKRSLVDIIRAKVSADESKYLRLLQHHRGLKEMILDWDRIGERFRKLSKKPGERRSDAENKSPL